MFYVPIRLTNTEHSRHRYTGRRLLLHQEARQGRRTTKDHNGVTRLRATPKVQPKPLPGRDSRHGRTHADRLPGRERRRWATG